MSFDQEAAEARTTRPRINTDQVFVEIRDAVSRINQNVRDIEKMNKELGSKKDNSVFRDQLTQLISQVRKDCTNAGQLLKQLSSSLGTQEARMTHSKLTKDFQTALGKFKEVTKFTMDKETSTPVPKPKVLEVDETTSLIEQQRQQELLMQQQAKTHNDALIYDREAGIAQIEKTMMDVQGIRVDMASLVQQQGAWIDDIESNVTVTHEEVKKSNDELRSAASSQKKSRNKLCIVIIILVLIAAGIGAFAAATGGFKNL